CRDSVSTLWSLSFSSITSLIRTVLPVAGCGASVSSVSTVPCTAPSYRSSRSHLEQTQVATYFFAWASKPIVNRPAAGTPRHSPRYSDTDQNPPNARVLSVPWLFTGGLPGSTNISASVRHSPSRCLSHSCSLSGAGGFGASCARATAPPTSTTAA